MPGNRRNRDDVLLLALAAGRSAVEAAQVAGVSESTVARRLQDPAFRQKLRDLRARVIDEAAGLLAAGAARAAQVLIDLLADPDARIRLGTATALLDRAAKYRELVELEAKVAKLAEELAKLRRSTDEAG
jgi:thioredoxin-like negative regulator of GroEL